MPWFGKKSVTPSDEAQAAHDSAKESEKQAKLDLEKAKDKLKESLPVIRAIKAHNDENHYDEFLKKLSEEMA